MQLIVTYNTPRPMEFEQRLRELEQRQRLSDSHRRLNVMRVDGSKSKAANVNAAVAAAEHELLVVYDADNIPEPDSLLHLHERMVSTDADVVQGMTYKIPSNPSCGRYVVQLMDTATMFLSTQLLAPVWLYFTPVKLTSQANCLMKIDVPRKVPFEPNLLVEDIDWCLRVHAQKWKSEYCCLSQVPHRPPSSPDRLPRELRQSLTPHTPTVAGGRASRSQFPLYAPPGPAVRRRDGADLPCPVPTTVRPPPQLAAATHQHHPPSERASERHESLVPIPQVRTALLPAVGLLLARHLVLAHRQLLDLAWPGAVAAALSPPLTTSSDQGRRLPLGLLQLVPACGRGDAEQHRRGGGQPPRCLHVRQPHHPFVPDWAARALRGKLAEGIERHIGGTEMRHMSPLGTTVLLAAARLCRNGDVPRFGFPAHHRLAR